MLPYRLSEILMHVEYYFGSFHLETNNHMRNVIIDENDNGWIFMHEILKWGMMKKHLASE